MASKREINYFTFPSQTFCDLTTLQKTSEHLVEKEENAGY